MAWPGGMREAIQSATPCQKQGAKRVLDDLKIMPSAPATHRRFDPQIRRCLLCAPHHIKYFDA